LSFYYGLRNQTASLASLTLHWKKYMQSASISGNCSQISLPFPFFTPQLEEVSPPPQMGKIQVDNFRNLHI
jgi:hypothetical protein